MTPSGVLFVGRKRAAAWLYSHCSGRDALVRAWAPYLLIGVLPLAILAVNGSFLANRLFDVDTWFYYGNFTSLGVYRDINVFVPHDYYQTRLPFILPGWLIFSVFSPLAARIVHYYLYYAVISFSLLYVLTRNTSRAGALLATIMMGTDIYFLRTTGWNYVDVGVLGYLALSYAALTAAGAGHRSLLWVATAAFCFACAVFTHLGAAVCAIPVAGYAWCSLYLEKTGWPRFATFVAAALAGGVVAQIVFGLLNVLIWHTSFFFLREQIAIAKYELSGPTAWRSLAELFATGPWLAMPVAVFLSSLCILLASALKLIKLDRFQICSLGSVAFLYALITVTDSLHRSEYLARQGLYAAFFMFAAYLAIGALIPKEISMRSVCVVLIFLMASLLIRLQFSGGVALPGADTFPPWVLGLVIAVPLGVLAFVRSQVVTVGTVCALAALSVFITWPFKRDDSIYLIHDTIQRLTGSRPPRFLLAEKDPLWRTLGTIVSSFGERAFLLTAGSYFPATGAAPWLHDRVFVLSSQGLDFSAVEHALAANVDSLKPLAAVHFTTHEGGLWAYEFDAVNPIVLPASLQQFQYQRENILAKSLPSLVGKIDGTARVAIAGQTPSGYLIYGPYANLAPATYDISIRYSAKGTGNLWDVAGADTASPLRIVKSGALADTGDSIQELHTHVAFSEGTVGVQIRVFYGGAGTLKVDSVGIKLDHAP